MPSAAAMAAFESSREAAPSALSGASAELLLGTAEDVVEKLSAETSFFDPEREAIFPHLDSAEMYLGRVLGRGGFCVVNEIKKIRLHGNGDAARMDEAAEKTKDVAFRRMYLQDRCVRDGDARYAIKTLLPECSSDPARFLKGAIDLAVEAKFLAVLEHQNIIKMRALSSGGHFAEGNFIVLDRLYDTLEQRFKKWNNAWRKTKGVMGKIMNQKKNKKRLVIARLHVAHDLAAAMNYMHSHNIIYRDLKPDNCGFDIRDDIKIFDFGLAKELCDKNETEDGTYKMTGFTGSLRYMAPEVARNEPYNLSADVFSFGMLFWQIMALEPPFVTYSCKMHDELVVRKGYRPALDRKWPSQWGDLMKACWSADPKARPNFQHVMDVLTHEAASVAPDMEFRADMDLSRRSVMLAKAQSEKLRRTSQGSSSRRSPSNDDKDNKPRRASLKQLGGSSSRRLSFEEKEKSRRASFEAKEKSRRGASFDEKEKSRRGASFDEKEKSRRGASFDEKEKSRRGASSDAREKSRRGASSEAKEKSRRGPPFDEKDKSRRASLEQQVSVRSASFLKQEKTRRASFEERAVERRESFEQQARNFMESLEQAP